MLNEGEVPTEEDLRVPESTARDYHARIVYADATELVPHSVQPSGSSATVPLCELVYDLALAPGDNVSQSPGFETPLGIFGGQSK